MSHRYLKHRRTLICLATFLEGGPGLAITNWNRLRRSGESRILDLHRGVIGKRQLTCLVLKFYSFT